MELTPDLSDTNPFRFAGMYWDTHTQTYMTPHRRLNPRLGRWTQPDPLWGIGNMIHGTSPITRNGHPMPNLHAIMQASNLFVFGINNPVKWVDPSGLEIVLSGTQSQREALLATLQKLTRDELSMRRVGVPWNRRYIVEFSAVSGDNLSHGTDLVRRLINSSHSVTIQNIPAAGGTGGRRTSYVTMSRFLASRSATVNMGTSRPSVWVAGDGGSQREFIPKHIELGHELIHALRHFEGNAYRQGYGMPLYVDHRGEVQRTKTPLEELHTIGLGFQMDENDPWIYPTGITENALRDEHGLPRRVRW